MVGMECSVIGDVCWPLVVFSMRDQTRQPTMVVRRSITVDREMSPGIEKAAMRDALAWHAAENSDNDETTDTDKHERRAADAF
jgi:hypothetical protein